MEEDIHGYDVTFLEQPEFDTLCSYCLFILKRPVQINPCGHRFCNDCIEISKRSCGDGPVRCPIDERKIQGMFCDIGIEKEILNLEIKCSNNGKGCSWTSSLRQLESHLEGCEFMEITCTNENCEKNMERRSLQDHLCICEYKRIECTSCSEDFMFINKQKHEEECQKLLLECENECGTTIPRDLMDKHVKEECTNLIHPCKYSSIGCPAKGTHSWLEEHEERNAKNHLSQAVGKQEKQSLELKECKTQLEILSQKFDYLYNLKSEKLHPKPFTYTINDIGNNLQNQDEILTEPFYCLDGYCLQMKIFLNGDCDGRDTHMSVHFQIVKGPFDNVLAWPFKGIVQFSVEENHLFHGMKKKLDTTKESEEIIESCLQKPTTNACKGLGISKFISHDLLTVRYILDDTLTITCHVMPAV